MKGVEVTLEVPRIDGFSRFLRAPSPTVGKPDARTTILPPMCDWGEHELERPAPRNYMHDHLVPSLKTRPNGTTDNGVVRKHVGYPVEHVSNGFLDSTIFSRRSVWRKNTSSTSDITSIVGSVESGFKPLRVVQ